MKCGNCGNEARGNFCTMCGARINIEDEVPEEKRAVSQPEAVIAEQTENLTEGNGETHSAPEATAKKSKAENFFSGLVSIVIAAVITYFLTKVNIGTAWIVCMWIAVVIDVLTEWIFDDDSILTTITSAILNIITIILLRMLNVNMLLLIAWLVIDLFGSRLFGKSRLVETISLILGASILFQAYCGYKDKRYIIIAQEQVYLMDLTYNDMLDKVSKDLEWKCIDRNSFTTVGVGSFDGQVTASGKIINSGIEYPFELKFYVSEEKEYALPVEVHVNGNELNLEEWLDDGYALALWSDFRNR